MKRISLLFMALFCYFFSSYGQTTYYWVAGTGNETTTGSTVSWNRNTSWNTAINGSGSARTNPAANDILIFDGSATNLTSKTINIANIPTDTMGQLILQNGVTVKMLTAAAPIQGAGTIAIGASYGTSVLPVTGTGATFTTFLKPGDYIMTGTSGAPTAPSYTMMAEVLSVNDNNDIVIANEASVALVSGTYYKPSTLNITANPGLLVNSGCNLNFGITLSSSSQLNGLIISLNSGATGTINGIVNFQSRGNGARIVVSDPNSLQFASGSSLVYNTSGGKFYYLGGTGGTGSAATTPKTFAYKGGLPGINFQSGSTFKHNNIQANTPLGPSYNATTPLSFTPSVAFSPGSNYIFQYQNGYTPYFVSSNVSFGNLTWNSTGVPGTLNGSSQTSFSLSPARIDTLTVTSIGTPSNPSASSSINPGSIPLYGDLINNSAVNLNYGAVSMLGSVAQNINGTNPSTSFRTLTVNNKNGVLISGTATDSITTGLNIAAGKLTVGNGTNATTVKLSGTANIIDSTGILTVAVNSTFDANDKNIVIKSTSAGTGAIGQVSGSLNNATNITVQRYIGTSRRAWRLLTAPVTGQNINAAWQEGQTGNTNTVANYGTLITGGSSYADTASAAAQGFDYTGSIGSSSIRVYTAGGTGTGGNWSASVPSTTGILVNGREAYMLFVRGDRSVNTTGSSTTTLRATGAYKTGSAVTSASSATVTVPATLIATHTLVGNPYPAPLSFDAMYTSNSSVIQRRFWIWDATQGTFGSYKLINYNGSAYEAIPYTSGSAGAPTTPTDLSTIQSGQGFFVEPNAGGTLNITEAHKTSAAVTTPIFRVGNGTSEKLWINLNQVNADNTVTLADGVQARYDNSYTTADNIGKATNFNENLAIARGGSNLIVQSRQLIDNSDTVFLKLWNTTARNYQFQLKADNFSNAPLTAYLEDKYLKTSTPVSLDGGISNVNFAVTSDAASTSEDRFMVVFKSQGVLPVSFTTVKAYEKERNIQVEWKVATETNTKAYEVEKSTNGRDFAKAGTVAATASGSYSWLDVTPAAGNNFYRIKVIDNGGEGKYSSIVRVNITKGTKGIGVYPNPITGNQFILELKNKLAGKYTVKLYNTVGQTLFNTTITHAGGSSTEAMSLPALSEGVYQLEVTDEGGAKDIIKLLKK